MASDLTFTYSEMAIVAEKETVRGVQEGDTEL